MKNRECSLLTSPVLNRGYDTSVIRTLFRASIEPIYTLVPARPLQMYIDQLWRRDSITGPLETSLETLEQNICESSRPPRSLRIVCLQSG